MVIELEILFRKQKLLSLLSNYDKRQPSKMIAQQPNWKWRMVEKEFKLDSCHFHYLLASKTDIHSNLLTNTEWEWKGEVMEGETINICSNTPKMKNDRLCSYTHTHTRSQSSSISQKIPWHMIKCMWWDREPTSRCDCWARRSEFWNRRSNDAHLWHSRTAFSMTCRQKSSPVSCIFIYLFFFLRNTLTQNRNSIECFGTFCKCNKMRRIK